MTRLLTMEDVPRLLLERTRRSESGCLEWMRGRDGTGYGNVHISGTSYRVNRLACELAHGPAPVDKPWALHTCDNRPCVEGSHLYWGTPRQNTLDRIDRGRDPKASQTHCTHGHEFTEENTYRKTNGRRMCRTCHRLRARANRARKAAA